MNDEPNSLPRSSFILHRFLPHRLQRAGEIRVAFKAMFQPRDRQNLLAVLIEIRELHLAEEILGLALYPHQCFQSSGTDELGFFEVDDEIDEMLFIYQLRHRLSRA